MYVPPKVKPLCPPEEKPRFEDVPYAQVTLDNGQDYTLKLDIYRNPEQNAPGPRSTSLPKLSEKPPVVLDLRKQSRQVEYLA